MNSPQIVIYIKLQNKTKQSLLTFPPKNLSTKVPRASFHFSASAPRHLQITHGHEVSNIMKMGGGVLFVLTMGSLSILTVPEQYVGMQRNTVNRETLCRTKFQEIYQPLYLSLWHIAQPSLSSGVFLLTMDTQLARLLCSFSCISKAISDSPVK